MGEANKSLPPPPNKTKLLRGTRQFVIKFVRLKRYYYQNSPQPRSPTGYLVLELPLRIPCES